MKLTKAITSTLAAVLLLSGACGNTREDRLGRRLGAFRNSLPAVAREAFDAGRYDECATAMKKALPADEAFAKRLRAVMDKEAISLFNEKEVVNYFRVYFVEKKMLEKNWEQLKK